MEYDDIDAVISQNPGADRYEVEGFVEACGVLGLGPASAKALVAKRVEAEREGIRLSEEPLNDATISACFAIAEKL